MALAILLRDGLWLWRCNNRGLPGLAGPRVLRLCGGESGIRTHGRVSPTHAFQACSLNHSDISPSLESTTCERSDSHYRTRRRLSLPFLHRVSFQRLTPRECGPRPELVSDLLTSR